MTDNIKGHQIFGNAAVFTKCRGDKNFAYVVALARAVNALNSAHSLMQHAADKNTPAATRDQWNSYFFVSAILYESLNLIRAMRAVFGKEKIFQDTIQTLLKDKTAPAGLDCRRPAAKPLSLAGPACPGGRLTVVVESSEPG